MAVYTPLTRDEVAAFVCGYELGELMGISPISEGVENTNYRLEFADLSCVLTLFEQLDFIETANVLSLLTYLGSSGVACPQPFAGANGTLGELVSRPAAIFPFIDGEHDPTPGHDRLEQLGRGLATIHRSGEGFDFTGTGQHSLVDIAENAEQLAGHFSSRSPELAELLISELNFQRGINPSGLPSGIIHGDLFLDNVLFERGGPRVAGLLDFYMADRGELIYDVAVTITDSCWRGDQLDGDSARAFLRGYRTVRQINCHEFEMLGAMLRRAALRFLVMRLEFYVEMGERMVEGKPKDPAEMARKLKAFRLLKQWDEEGFCGNNAL